MRRPPLCIPWIGPQQVLGQFLLGVGNQRSVVVMRETEFFQERAIQCNTFAAGAADGSHQEFWLQLARRWLECRARQCATAGDEMLPSDGTRSDIR